MKTADTPASQPSKARGCLRRIGFALLLALFALLNLELFLRYVALGGSRFAIEHGWRFRQPSLYADPDTDAYWALTALHQPQGPDRPPNEDELLGWSNWRRDDGSYRHEGYDQLNGRTPILLYGDSFAQGMTEPAHLFQNLLAQSEHATDHLLLNHGQGGYGMGQTYLMLRETLDDYVGKNPIVIIGVYLDADLDRTRLSLRQYPKPRFFLENDELQIDPPQLGGREAWIESNGVGITSYLWSYLLHGVRGVPASFTDRFTGTIARREDKCALNRAVFTAMKAELDRRNMRGFVILFPGRSVLGARRGFTWQEPYMATMLQEIGLPFVTVRTDLSTAHEEGATLDDVFLNEGPALGHYNSRGNKVAFRTLLRGVAGNFDG